MYTRNKYCCICGSIFLLPTICNPVDHTEAEEVILDIENPYDSRVLSQEKILVSFKHPYSLHVSALTA